MPHLYNKPNNPNLAQQTQTGLHLQQQQHGQNPGPPPSKQGLARDSFLSQILLVFLTPPYV
jgi:hypothetical protein